jgi:hypothetical protein
VCSVQLRAHAAAVQQLGLPTNSSSEASSRSNRLHKHRWVSWQRKQQQASRGTHYHSASLQQQMQGAELKEQLKQPEAQHAGFMVLEERKAVVPSL